jgi:ribosomal protein L24E
MTETKPTRTARRGRIFPEIQWTEEQQAQWEAERKEFKERCQPIFDKVKAELIETHYNWFVAVEPDSGEYFVDKDSSVASRQCREKHPAKIPHIFRINETGVCGTI